MATGIGKDVLPKGQRVTSHPFFPLIVALERKCQLAAGTSATEKIDLRKLMNECQIDTKSLGVDPELDTYLIKYIQAQCLHYHQMSSVNMLAGEFVERYMSLLRGAEPPALETGTSSASATTAPTPYSGGDFNPSGSREGDQRKVGVGDSDPAADSPAEANSDQKAVVADLIQAAAQASRASSPGTLTSDNQLTVVKSALDGISDTELLKGGSSSESSNSEGSSSDRDGVPGKRVEAARPTSRDAKSEQFKNKHRVSLPKSARLMLRQWFYDHIIEPFPSDEEKQLIMSATGLTPRQVGNWFINVRRRVWHPMLEDARSQAALARDSPPADADSVLEDSDSVIAKGDAEVAANLSLRSPAAAVVQPMLNPDRYDSTSPTTAGQAALTLKNDRPAPQSFISPAGVSTPTPRFPVVAHPGSGPNGVQSVKRPSSSSMRLSIATLRPQGQAILTHPTDSPKKRKEAASFVSDSAANKSPPKRQRVKSSGASEIAQPLEMEISQPPPLTAATGTTAAAATVHTTTVTEEKMSPPSPRSTRSTKKRVLRKRRR